MLSVNEDVPEFAASALILSQPRGCAGLLSTRQAGLPPSLFWFVMI